MATPSPSNHYHAIIIGSGQAGTPLASAFQAAGHRTLLIEREHLGGCCVNVGCTPTKTLIASGRNAYAVRRSTDYGIGEKGSSGVVVDMLKVRQRKRDIVESFRGGSERRLREAGVDILMGEASFVAAKTIRVRLNSAVESRQEEQIVTGDKIFLNIGERPAPTSFPGIESLNPNLILDSTSIQELDHVPERLVVVGGGYVGLEFAQLFQRLGAHVTIIQRGPQLLPREDADIAQEMLKILQDDGIDVHLSSHIVNVSSTTSTLEVQTPTAIKSTPFTYILFAAGRVPNTTALNLSAASVGVDSKGYIRCDEYLATTAPDVYVLGDAKGPPAFTHISYDDFRIISHNLLPSSTTSTTSKRSTTDRLIPYVVYTDPQLGHIGLHEHEARALYPEEAQNAPKRIRTASMPMSYVARALETDESRGMMKAVVDRETGLILGFTCLGMEGGELMAVVQMAMMGKVRWEVLRDAVWAHPSLAESLNNLWSFLK